jgi:hypothetical protein
MGDTHFYEPKDGDQLPHDPFKAIVAPRPIGWMSTASRPPNTLILGQVVGVHIDPAVLEERSVRHCGGRDDRAVRLPGRLRRGHASLRDVAPVF